MKSTKKTVTLDKVKYLVSSKIDTVVISLQVLLLFLIIVKLLLCRQITSSGHLTQFYLESHDFLCHMTLSCIALPR